MKPKNFPGRKNDRRKAAMKRLGSPNVIGFGAAADEWRTLAKRIVSDHEARGIRTKKDRTSCAKVRA